MAWWRYADELPRPMSDSEISQLPVKGGLRSKAMASQSELRRALLPPDPPEDTDG